MKVPSSVNGWLYGELIKSFTMVPPHGPVGDTFDRWNVNAVVHALAMNAPNLEDLNLSNCSQVVDAPISQVARHCTKLQKLNLNRCDLVSSYGVLELAKYGGANLTILNLNRPLLSQRTLITDEAVYALVKKTPRLMELRLRNIDLLTDRTVVEIAQTAGANLLAVDLRYFNS
jgi:F-box/leucine-rich repeat protein 2/20